MKKIRLLDFVTGEEAMKSRNTVVNSDIWHGKKIRLYLWACLERNCTKKEIRLLHKGRQNIQLTDSSHGWMNK